ncbi:unnamed protein product [Rotaria magnacalcarata]|uniref:aralkylamine N-acetyltransferase n=2 Tax=Rotaria magnacalcarata TaxID=392030 RepID=A0A815THF0_9BILA|nr:unnamed protein product [Rotaria magnacalcarata]CAF1686024.1 unnamed protein product [Rotaria magnacalcarata]
MSRHLMNIARLSNYRRYIHDGYRLFNKSHCRKFHQDIVNKRSSSPSISLCLMKSDHRDEASSVLNESFFSDEPLSNFLSLHVPNDLTEFTKMSFDKALQDKCSYVAIDNNQQKIIGVLISLIENVNDNTNIIDSQIKSEKMRYILKLLETLHNQINLFQIFNTDRLLHVLMITVNQQYRGLNLTRQLINLSLEQAKILGIKGAFAEATGIYSTKAMLKMGFQKYDEVIYDKYDPKRLSGLGIHDRCALLAKSL